MIRREPGCLQRATCPYMNAVAATAISLITHALALFLPHAALQRNNGWSRVGHAATGATMASERWASCDDVVHHTLAYLDARSTTALSLCSPSWRDAVLRHACRSWAGRLGGASPWRLRVPSCLRGGVQEGRLETAHHLRSAVHAFAMSCAQDEMHTAVAHPWKPVFANRARRGAPSSGTSAAGGVATGQQSVQVVWRTAFAAKRWSRRRAGGGGDDDVLRLIVLEHRPTADKDGSGDVSFPPPTPHAISGGGALWLAVRVLEDDVRARASLPDVARVTLHIRTRDAADGERGRGFRNRRRVPPRGRGPAEADRQPTTLTSVAYRVLRSLASAHVWYMLCNAGASIHSAHLVVGTVHGANCCQHPPPTTDTDAGGLQPVMRVAEVRAVACKLPLPPTHMSAGEASASPLLPGLGERRAAHYVCRPWEATLQQTRGGAAHVSRIPDASAQRCARHALECASAGAPFRACVYNSHTEMTSTVAHDTIDVALWLEWLRVGRSDATGQGTAETGGGRQPPVVPASPDARMRIPVACGCGPVRTWDVKLL